MNEAWIERLLENDPDAWAVQLDALLEQGDPRAELGLAQPEPVRHRDLSTPWKRWIGRHGLTAPLERAERHELTWMRGHWHGLANRSTSQPASFWDQALAAPVASCLQGLAVRRLEPGVLLGALQRHRPPLRRLHWNDREGEVDLDPFFAVLPHLRHLHLWRPVRFSSAPQRSLQILAVNPGPAFAGTQASVLRLGEQGQLRQLDTLELWGVGAEHAWLGALLATCRPRVLALRGSVDGAIVEPLVRSPAFGGLRELTLQGFWPDEAALDVLITALEDREPLHRYQSTGHVPDETQVKRLERCATWTAVRS